jgi:cyclic pyranopterin phosphate synthase
MRNGGSDDALRRLVADLWIRRAERYSERRGENGDAHDQPKFEMSFIGG